MARPSQPMPPSSNSNVLPKAPWELWLSRTAPRPTSANTPPNAMVKRRKPPLLKLLHSSARSLMFKVTKVISPSSNAESSQDHTFHGHKMARRSTRLISGMHLAPNLKKLGHTGNWPEFVLKLVFDMKQIGFRRHTWCYYFYYIIYFYK